MFLDRSVSYGHVNFIGTRVNCKGALNTGRNYCSFLFRKREIKAAFNTVFDETGGWYELVSASASRSSRWLLAKALQFFIRVSRMLCIDGRGGLLGICSDQLLQLQEYKCVTEQP
jgi:hypothetical protein